jgi:hypothetical protein
LSRRIACFSHWIFIDFDLFLSFSILHKNNLAARTTCILAKNQRSLDAAILEKQEYRHESNGIFQPDCPDGRVFDLLPLFPAASAARRRNLMPIRFTASRFCNAMSTSTPVIPS